MITCEHVRFEYEIARPVLKDVSLHIQPGSFHFLSGTSGAGKTSLLALLSLARKPTGGRLTMFGEEVGSLTRAGLTALRRRVGLVSQDFGLLEHLSVAENVGLPLKVQGESESGIRVKVDELLAWVGLEDFHRAQPAELSGGQKQRVAIARAVIGTPDLLLADEPTGNLDPKLSLKFMYLFEALNKNSTTVLIATHDENLISRFNYPVLRLKDGKLVKNDLI